MIGLKSFLRVFYVSIVQTFCMSKPDVYHRDSLSHTKPFLESGEKEQNETVGCGREGLSVGREKEGILTVKWIRVDGYFRSDSL